MIFFTFDPLFLFHLEKKKKFFGIKYIQISI